MFLGMSSPTSMVTTVLTTRATAYAAALDPPSPSPRSSNGPCSRVPKAGSAKNPMARLVIVIPSWAPLSWVESERRAFRVPAAPWSPASASRSTVARSTVTNENSAATKTPQASIRKKESASSNHSVMRLVRQGRDRPR